MDKPEVKQFTSPDERRSFNRGELKLVHLGEGNVGMARFEPGWKWSNDVKPVVGTSTCEQHHVGYVMSGRMLVRMNDGEQIEIGPGDIVNVPPGHDAWVIGDEPCAMIDWTGMGTYAQPAVSPEARPQAGQAPEQAGTYH